MVTTTNLIDQFTSVNPLGSSCHIFYKELLIQYVISVTIFLSVICNATPQQAAYIISWSVFMVKV